MNYRLLDSFRDLFEGQAYLHRKSNLGDFVAMHLYEDLHRLARSEKYVDRVNTGLSVLNTQNLRQGIKARRGDGSFGEIVPNTAAIQDEGFTVHRGSIATIEIGTEVKILMKAMIKQIDRVISDLKGQAQHFRSRGGNPICVGVVGINRAPWCTSYEGTRSFQTEGRKYKHPIDEAAAAEERLRQLAAPSYNEFLILRFEATNEPPYPFAWTNENSTFLDYGAALARISQQYKHGDKEQDQPTSIAIPNVIPIRYGREGLLEGLFLKNVGEKPALDITVDPIQVGLWSVSFIGPEITLIEPGHTCFFEVNVEGPPTPLASGSRLFRALRGWQNDTKDWSREVTGHIQYKDLNGVSRKTTYKVEVDVLNRDCSVVVRIVTDQKN